MARLARWFCLALVALLVSFVIGVVVHAPVCLPFDWVWNLGPTIEAPDLRVADDGRVRVVFLQHGMWRTARSLDRLARSLRAAGYEVVNEGYPSTRDRIEGHAERLRDVVERRFAEGPIDELYFVGHSMGGLVIEEYLRREDARVPTRCVYIATPHRGAILADLRRHWFLFRFVMGDQASFQLATTDPLHERPIPYGECSGTVIGDVGAGNRSIPGNDDGTVGVDEATFDGAADRVTVPCGHTNIVVAAPVVRHVLRFLRDGGF